MIPKPKTVKDKGYRNSFRFMSCIVCGLPGDNGEVVGHHLGHNKDRDDWLVALCGKHHQGHPESVHVAAKEPDWWMEHRPGLVAHAMEEFETDDIMEALKMWAGKQYDE